MVPPSSRRAVPARVRGELPARLAGYRIAPRSPISADVGQVAEAVKAGRRYPELIGVRPKEGNFILVEGHTHATAYVVAGIREEAEFLVGSSLHMRRWEYY